MSVELTTGVNELPMLRLSHRSGATAELYLHGAQVTSWVPAGQEEALFLSRQSLFEPGSATRGGIPVCFPQFSGLGPLPKHGFARTQLWDWQDDAAEGAGGAARARLTLRDNEATRQLWLNAFRAGLDVTLDADALTVRLNVENTGAGAFGFTAALHTYFRLADVRAARVTGLRGTRFRSALEGEHVDEASELTVSGEVDRVYFDAPRELRLHDGRTGRSLRIGTEGFRDAVVWNPWAELAARLPDFGDDEYLQMLCIEAAQVGQPVELAGGETWSGAQRLEVVAA